MEKGAIHLWMDFYALLQIPRRADDPQRQSRLGAPGARLIAN